MRTGICILLTLLLLSGHVSGIGKLNSEGILASQQYGKTMAHYYLRDFFRPWTVYEEKAEKLDESADSAHVFSPFLLVASDARDRTLKGQDVKIKDAEKVLNEYYGYLVFGVTLHGKIGSFNSKPRIFLRQGKSIVYPQAVYFPDKPAADYFNGDRVYEMNGYVYFLIKDIVDTRPVVLQIRYEKMPVKNFYFDLDKFR